MTTNLFITLEINKQLKKCLTKILFLSIYYFDKIKFTYLKEPNPTKDKVIAFANALPSEFDLDSHIDRDMQFEKAYLEPIKSVLNVVGWQYEKQESLESFFI